MQTLEALTREAAELAQGRPAPHQRLADAEEAEVVRVLQICNACRYCEGFCAVFPAMTRRLQFDKADVHFLANLCHLLGTTGGVSLMVGTAGLWWLNRRRHPLQGDPAQRPMDLAFIALQFLVAASGLALMWLKGTPALALTLCVHLGAVMAFFATMPYGKFAHGMYRGAALLKWSIEKRSPSKLQLGDD